MSIVKRAIPFAIFIFIAFTLWRGLALHPTLIPSPLINKSAPNFELPDLLSSNKATNKDFLGHVTLLNVWATWCFACANEHEFLLQLSKNENFVIYGLNYKDDKTAATIWLKKYGNPYKKVAVDQDGTTAIDFGVYGAPETFIIDKKGIIRYKHIGAVTALAWEKHLKPLVDQLRNESI